MGGDNIIFYQAPKPTKKSRDDSREDAQPSVSTQQQQWVRFKEYQPKAKSFSAPGVPPKKPPPKSKSKSTNTTTTNNNELAKTRQQVIGPSRPRDRSTAHAIQWQESSSSAAGQHLLVLPQAISAADPDPFNALPSKTDPYAARMLQLYTDKDLLTAVFSRNTPTLTKLWLEQRKQKWLPLAMTSFAAFNALVLYMETAPGMPTGEKMAVSHRRRLAMAFNALNEDLRDPEKQAADATAFAVILLMNTAEHMGDFEAFSAHSIGLEAIVARRRNLPAAVLPKMRPDSSHIDQYINVQASRKVFRKELLEHLRYWHESALSFRVIIYDEWVTSLASQHMMTTGFPFGGKLLPVEEALSETLKLNAARMFPTKVPSLNTAFRQQHSVSWVCARLKDCGMDYLMDVTPDCMAWAAIVNGPVSHEEDTTVYFESLLRRAVRSMGIHTYRQAQDAIRAQSMLPVPFDKLSRRFWAQAVGGGQKPTEEDVPDYLNPGQGRSILELRKLSLDP